MVTTTEQSELPEREGPKWEAFLAAQEEFTQALSDGATHEEANTIANEVEASVNVE